MGFSLRKSQRQWLIAFLSVSLLLPIMCATLLVGIGNASGCQMLGETAPLCEVQGINIGQTIAMLVDLNGNILVLSVFQVPILSIGLSIGLLVLIYKSFRGWTRTLVGFFSIWYICFAPLIAGFVFVVSLANQAPQCSLNAGGVGSCYLFGVDMVPAFYTTGMSPLLVFFLFPACILISVAYVGYCLSHR